MASGQTEHYGLNQWEGQDQILREEFNGDNLKIDAALFQIPHLELGTYTGDGTTSRFIELGYTPRAIYVTAADGMSFRHLSGADQLCGGFAMLGHPCYDLLKNRLVLEICENGFRVNYSADTAHCVYTNVDGTEYRYIALK